MRRTLVATAACALAALLAAPSVPSATPAPSASVLPLVRVRVPDARTAALVANTFDESHEHHPGFVEIVLWPGDAARLAKLGLTYEVVVPDLRTHPDEWAGPESLPVELPGPDRTDYRRLADYNAEMADLAKRNPGLVRLLTLKERTIEGRPVHGIEIAVNVAGKDGRPTFLVDGVHHAREWPAGEYPMIYAHDLLERFKRGDRFVTGLLRRLRVVIVPIVNPDGFDYSREAPVDGNSLVGQAAYWRKNRRAFTDLGPLPEPIGFNPDAYGVDPNRNYGYMWGDDIGGSSSEPQDENHRGEAAFSEPESRNIEALMLARPVTALVTNHTSGRLVMHPWGWTDEETPNAEEKIFVHVGQRMADAMGGYKNISAIELYPTSGGSRDWGYGALGTLTYTFEHGESFHPPYATGVAIWADVMEAFDIAASAAADPKLHSVVTGRVLHNGRPVPATLTLSKRIVNPLWPDNPSGADTLTETFRTSTAAGRDGSFGWHVMPSVRPWQADAANEAYTLTVSYGGRTKTLRVLARRGQTVRLGTIRL